MVGRIEGPSKFITFENPSLEGRRIKVSTHRVRSRRSFVQGLMGPQVSVKPLTFRFPLLSPPVPCLISRTRFGHRFGLLLRPVFSQCSVHQTCDLSCRTVVGPFHFDSYVYLVPVLLVLSTPSCPFNPPSFSVESSFEVLFIGRRECLNTNREFF